MSSDFIRISSNDMESEFSRILQKYRFSPERAKTCAEVFTDNSVDGVYSHGFNRFTKFIGLVKEGYLHPEREAILKNRAGGIEQWDGQAGPGPVNALLCTIRAMEIAMQNGIGCVALANTNHWMRGGTYGWRAAKEGFVFIGWSNTIANTPAWGATNCKLGNNPLVIAVPYQGEAIVLDMAMSQYSYGALEMAELKNEMLSVPGGYDLNGRLTTNPSEIRKSQRPLPIGYWKGAGLSLLLDILGTILSGGLSVSEITKQNSERKLSQVFIAIDITKLANFKTIAFTIGQIIDDYHQSIPEKEGKRVRHPGQQVLKIRSEHMSQGIPVPATLWKEITSM